MRSYLCGLAILALSAAQWGCGGSEPGGGPEPGRGSEPGGEAENPRRQSRQDLSGVWIGPATTLEPPAPMTSRGQALFDAARPLYGPRSLPVADSNDPVILCDPQGFPRILFLRAPLSGMELVQTADRVFQYFQYQRVYREIWTDGRSLPSDVGGDNPQSPDPRWYGYSIGRWSDAGEFVVETVGATETWGDEEGHPHGLGARIEERYRLLDRDTMELVVRVDDPEMYQQPFIASTQIIKRGKELTPQICVPSEAMQYLELIAKPAGTR